MMELYMVVEHFKGEDAVPVYRRFRERGHMAPEGFDYVSSWVDDKLARCYQVMETNDRTLLDEWMANWSDLIDFEVHSVAPPKKSSETPSKISCVPPKKQPLALGAASTRFQVPQFQGQKRRNIHVPIC